MEILWDQAEERRESGFATRNEGITYSQRNLEISAFSMALTVYDYLHIGAMENSSVNLGCSAGLSRPQCVPSSLSTWGVNPPLKSAPVHH